MPRQLEPTDLPFMLGLDSESWAPIAEHAAAQLPDVTVSMPLVLALAMWEAIGVVSRITRDDGGVRVLTGEVGDVVSLDASMQPKISDLLAQLVGVADARTKGE